MSLEPPIVAAITGPSGSGKSTLLGIVAGWTAPTAGRVVRDGIKRTAWVFQNPFGVARRTALDHVTLPLMARGMDRSGAEVVGSSLLNDFGLREAASRRFSALSGGEGQRLMLARAVASDPDLLLIDEPTAQLDRHSATTVIEVIRETAASNRIVLVASHDLDLVERCDVLFDLARLG